MTRAVIGFLARMSATVCGFLICGVALFGEVQHHLLPGASAHVALFLLGCLTIVRAWTDDTP
jgi:hypothetical protein